MRSEPTSPDSPSWDAPPAAGPISATVALPGSKSLTNRYLILAGLAHEPSRLRAPLRSRDTLLMVGALRAVGARVEDAGGGDWLITPGPLVGGGRVDCGLAGTVMRFVPAVAALCTAPVLFDGDEQARVRPMRPVLDALRQLGAPVDDFSGGSMPFRVGGTGRVPGGALSLDASASSQFVSALLLAGARYDNGVEIAHVGAPIPSLPHIAMTVETLRDAGGIVDDTEPDRWRVEPGELSGLDVVIEPDLSNAGAFLAAALVTGGRVTVPGWPQHTTQAGDALRDIIDAMGGSVRLDRAGLTVTGEGAIGGIDIDLHEASELTPILAAVAALADGPSIIRGVGHIRGHETDRLSALRTELERVGAHVEERTDGLRIVPGSLRPTRWRTYADHRMVMAGAIIGLAVPGLVIEDVGTVAKTMPTFTQLWEQMLGLGGDE